MSIDLAKEDKQILKSIYENSKMGIAVYNFVNDSFEIVNETTPKIHDFILEFHNTKFYIISLVIYGIK